MQQEKSLIEGERKKNVMVHNIWVKFMKRLALIGLTIMMLAGANTEATAATNACNHPSFHVYMHQETSTVKCNEVTGCDMTNYYDCKDEICNNCGVTLRITKILYDQTHTLH